jgi:hypothetical protein
MAEQEDRVSAAQDDVLSALYDPATGMVGCVLLHAAHGIRDRRVNTIFSASEWFVQMSATVVPLRMSLADWRKIAALPRAQRPRLADLRGAA